MALTVDVDGMLASMEPALFSEWLHYYSIKPWGDDWLQAGVIASTVKNNINAALSAHAGHDMKAEDYCDPEDFIPSNLPAAKKKSISKNMQESQVFFRSKFGA